MRVGIGITTFPWRAWRGDESPYRGRHYQLVRPLNSPNSVQRPHPPILIGGSGEDKTLRLVARYADACNCSTCPPRSSATTSGTSWTCWGCTAPRPPSTRSRRSCPRYTPSSQTGVDRYDRAGADQQGADRP